MDDITDIANPAKTIKQRFEESDCGYVLMLRKMSLQAARQSS
jgi:hypothetical protein